MDNRIRVLHVITGMGSGGAEMFLINMYRNMDHSRIVFDFLLQSDENLYRKELESYGSRIYQIPAYFEHPLQNRTQLREVLKQPFSAIHVHANALLYVLPLFAAKKAGVPCRIMHSHSSSMYYKWAMPWHQLNRKRIKRCATHCFACSDPAGHWMFEGPYTVIQNAIDLDAFSFQPELRSQQRHVLGIEEETLVLGQVGRLSEVKNQLFTLDCFSHIVRQRPDSLLLFVGSGYMESELRSQAQQLGIIDRIRFLGIRTDVNLLENVFDAVLCPSLYEGLGITVIEAQANGLPVFCSTAVPDQAAVSADVRRLPLEAGPAAWAEEILKNSLERRDHRRQLEDAGYDVRLEAKKLQAFYLAAEKER